MKFKCFWVKNGHNGLKMKSPPDYPLELFSQSAHLYFPFLCTILRRNLDCDSYLDTVLVLGGLYWGGLPCRQKCVSSVISLEIDPVGLFAWYPSRL